MIKKAEEHFAKIMKNKEEREGDDGEDDGGEDGGE